MDKGQILMDYRLAKNHKGQIPILADLNACDTQTIVEILEEGGYKRMFNTNGVDISVKKTEIEQKFSSRGIHSCPCNGVSHFKETD